MKYLYILFVIVLFTSYVNNETKPTKISSNIYKQIKFSNPKIIDFSKLIPIKFDKVCFFGPYSTNIHTEKILGFYWDIESKTKIHMNDSINVITFIRDNKVIEYTEHSRSKGDFWRLSNKCFKYNNSKIILISGRDNWILKK